jgi:hypothetical protein
MSSSVRPLNINRSFLPKNYNPKGKYISALPMVLWQPAVAYKWKICSAPQLIAFPHTLGQVPPDTASTKSPLERPLHFETCQMAEEAGYAIEMKRDVSGAAAADEAGGYGAGAKYQSAAS